MIGERLTDLRNDKGLKQRELAEILHVTNHNISAYERDKNEPPDSVKIAMARYFDVSVDYLLGLTDSPNAYEKPGNYILLDKDFPPAAKPLVQTIARMISLLAKEDPKKVEKEVRRLSAELLAQLPAVSEYTNEETEIE